MTVHAVDLLELLPPATAGRIETLAGVPIRTIGAQVDDGTATVATLTVLLAQCTGTDLSEAAGRYRTVVALRRAVDGVILARAQQAIGDARDAHAAQDAADDGQQSTEAEEAEDGTPAAGQEDGGGA